MQGWDLLCVSSSPSDFKEEREAALNFGDLSSFMHRRLYVECRTRTRGPIKVFRLDMN